MVELNKNRRKLLWLGASLFVALSMTCAFLYKQHTVTQPPIINVGIPVQNLTASTHTFRGLPTNLKIPKLNVDTSIEYLGNTPKGEMAVPSGPKDVAWYKYGPIPGEVGSAVIAGHVVGAQGERAIFYELDMLQPGDIFEVTDAKGNVASFTVSHKARFDQSQQPQEVFNSSSGTHLNLVTCTGDWDATNHHYRSRLVVFADLSP